MNHVYDDGGVYIPNLSNCAEQYGISQYRFPHNFELAGKDLSITAADKKYTLSFKCRKNLEFDGSKYAYECLKFGPELYFVLFGLNVAVIDLDKCLATLILGDEYVHGSIDCPDKECKCGCSAVHGCAGDEMVGTKVASSDAAALRHRISSNRASAASPGPCSRTRPMSRPAKPRSSADRTISWIRRPRAPASAHVLYERVIMPGLRAHDDGRRRDGQGFDPILIPVTRSF